MVKSNFDKLYDNFCSIDGECKKPSPALLAIPIYGGLKYAKASVDYKNCVKQQNADTVTAAASAALTAQTQSTQNNKPGMSTGMIIGLSVGGIILLGGIGWLVFRKKTAA